MNSSRYWQVPHKPEHRGLARRVVSCLRNGAGCPVSRSHACPSGCLWPDRARLAPAPPPPPLPQHSPATSIPTSHADTSEISTVPAAEGKCPESDHLTRPPCSIFAPTANEDPCRLSLLLHSRRRQSFQNSVLPRPRASFEKTPTAFFASSSTANGCIFLPCVRCSCQVPKSASLVRKSAASPPVYFLFSSLQGLVAVRMTSASALARRARCAF